MLSLKMADLDPEASMIAQASRVRMLKHMSAILAKEEEEARLEAVAASMNVTPSVSETVITITVDHYCSNFCFDQLESIQNFKCPCDVIEINVSIGLDHHGSKPSPNHFN